MGIKIARIICKSYANLSGNLWLHIGVILQTLSLIVIIIPRNPVMYIMFMLAGTYHESPMKTRVGDHQYQLSTVH